MTRRNNILAIAFGAILTFSCSTAISCAAETKGGNDLMQATVWGDSNCNEQVEVADAISILQSIANPTEFMLTEQGRRNADVSMNGDGVSAEDALSIQKYLADIIPELPESYQNPVEKQTTMATTSTTATSTTTSTTTGKKSNWIPPQPEELVHDGEQISDDTYKILLNTAKTFGIESYKIIWSDEPIEYAYTDPGMYECMCQGVAYGYGVQIASAHYVYKASGFGYESYGNIEILCPTWSKLKKGGWEQNQYFWFRPIVPEDENPEVLANVDNGYDFASRDYDSGLILCDIFDINEDPNGLFSADFYDCNNSFQFANWYLIPVDAEGNEILELNKKESYDITKTEVETKYWLSAEEIHCGSMNRVNYKDAVKTAEYYGWTDFTVVDSEEAILYAYAIGSPSWYNIKYYGQIIPFEDVNQFDDKFVSENLDYLLFPREALLTIEGEVVGTEGYEVFGGSTNIDLTGTYLIPLDSEGNQILELLTR